MNQSEKRQFATYLLDEIGGIDDAILTEATHWHATRTQKRNPLRRVLLVAASLSLVFVIGLGSMLTMLLRGGDKNAPTTPEATPSVNDYDTLSDFDSLYAQAIGGESFTLSTADEIPYFDGTVRVTLQSLETGETYVSRPLSESEQTLLAREKQRVGTSVSPSALSQDYRVWILLGDGTVYTPHLADTVGNVGVAELFAYESERIPTDYFAALLTSLS